MTVSKEMQKELERKHNSNLLLNRVFKEIKKDKSLQDLVISSKVNLDLANKVLAYMCIYKRMYPDALLGILFEPDRENSLSLEEISQEIELMVKSDLIRYDSDDGRFIVRFVLEKSIQEELDLYQYPLPMIVTPKIIKSNNDSGYLLKGKESVLLNNRRTREDAVLEHLNLINQTQFSINTEILPLLKNEWKGDSDMSKRQLDRFNKYCAEAQKIMLNTGNKFYFNHRFDYRGRCYCEGYYLNYQGNSYCKAVLEFANKEVIQE